MDICYGEVVLPFLWYHQQHFPPSYWLRLLECSVRSIEVCENTLACGHPCNGVKGEEVCLPCLHGCVSDTTKLKQDADDMCMICYTEGLSCAPCVQVRVVVVVGEGGMLHRVAGRAILLCLYSRSYTLNYP